MKRIKRIYFCFISLVILFSLSLQCFCAPVLYTYVYFSLDILNSDKFTEHFFDRRVAGPWWSDLDSYVTVSSDVEEEKVNNLSFSTSAVSDEYGSIFDQLYTVSAYVYYWVELDSGEIISEMSAKRSTTGYSVTSEISATAGEDFDKKHKVKDFHSQHMFDQRLARIQIEFVPMELWRDKIIFDPMQHGGQVVYPIR